MSCLWDRLADFYALSKIFPSSGTNLYLIFRFTMQSYKSTVTLMGETHLLNMSMSANLTFYQMKHYSSETLGTVLIFSPLAILVHRFKLFPWRALFHQSDQISLPESCDLISLCCLWQAIIYFHLPRSSLCSHTHVLLNMWPISTGIWPNKHNLGCLCQLRLTFTAHFTHTLKWHHTDTVKLYSITNTVSSN